MAVYEESFIRNIEFVLRCINEVKRLLDYADTHNDCTILSKLIDKYDELFNEKDIRKYVHYKISGVGNSTHALQTMQMNGPNARRHITIQLNPELDLIDALYGYKLSELTMLFKYLFSAVENLAIYQNHAKLNKYIALLDEIGFSIRELIKNHTQVSKQQNLLNQQLSLREKHENGLRSAGVLFKSEAEDLYSILKNNGINKLYHFTESENIESIKRNGGIWTRDVCERNGINIVNPGGDQFSLNLDKMKNAINYVRLSFCKYHPMKKTIQEKKRMNNPVVLEIDASIIDLIGTKFCEKNASRRDAIIKYDMNSFKDLPFNLFEKDYTTLSESEKEAFQAEILVYENVPLKYITNLTSLS
jgi:hypothetical protein